MTLQRLSSDFVNFQVVHATGIELDIIRCCHDFMLENCPNYSQTWACEESIEYLLGETDGLSYFAHEQLPDYMQEIAPLGTYFGSHEGDATLGFWSVSPSYLEELGNG